MPVDFAANMNEAFERFFFAFCLSAPLRMLRSGNEPESALSLILARARVIKLALEIDPRASWDLVSASALDKCVLYRELPEEGNCTVCVVGRDGFWRLFGQDSWQMNTILYSREEALEVLKEMPAQRVLA